MQLFIKKYLDNIEHIELFVFGISSPPCQIYYFLWADLLKYFTEILYDFTSNINKWCCKILETCEQRINFKKII